MSCGCGCGCGQGRRAHEKSELLAAARLIGAVLPDIVVHKPIGAGAHGKVYKVRASHSQTLPAWMHNAQRSPFRKGAPGLAKSFSGLL